MARRLVRIAAGLTERHAGSLEALAGAADSLEQLGARLASLAPGLGGASVSRFLRPLRDIWPTASDLPLDPAAHAAAVHLGWLEEGQDLEAAPGALRRALATGKREARAASPREGNPHGRRAKSTKTSQARSAARSEPPTTAAAAPSP